MSAGGIEGGFGPADADGFHDWHPPETGRFIAIFGAMRVRCEGPATVRCRVVVGHAQANVTDNIHGGFILAFVDQAPFCAAFVLERLSVGGAVTLAASVNFIGAGMLDQPLDAVVEIVGETGRMLFTRGLMEQDGRLVASFEVTLRKTTARAAHIAGE